MKKQKTDHKAVIETIINTTAIALTSTGTMLVTARRDWWGFTLIGFAMLLEWFKYYGRQSKLW